MPEFNPDNWLSCSAEEKTYVGIPHAEKNTQNQPNVLNVLNPAGDFTLEAWAKVTGGQGSQRCVLSSRAVSPKPSGYFLEVRSGNYWDFWMGKDGGWVCRGHRSPEVVVDSWTHLAVVCVANEPRENFITRNFYVNGEAGGADWMHGFLPNTTAPLRIGASGPGDPNSFFQGDIAQVRIWNKALAADEIKDHYDNPSGFTPPPQVNPPNSNLVGWWPLNEGAGTIAVDHSGILDAEGNGNHGTIHSSGNNTPWGHREVPGKRIIQVTHNPLWKEKNYDNKIDYKTDRRAGNPRHIFLGMPTANFPEGQEIEVSSGDTIAWLFPTGDSGAVQASPEGGDETAADFFSKPVPSAANLEGTVKDHTASATYKYNINLSDEFITIDNQKEPVPIDPRLKCRGRST